MREKKREISEKDKYIPLPDFKRQTPSVFIGDIKWDHMYKKAFLEHSDSNDCEYCRNTTPWD